MLRKLAGNTAVGLLGTTALKALGFVTTLVLARGLGEQGFGVYTFVGAYIFFFGFFVDLGMERVVTRELSDHPDRIGRLIGNAIIVKLMLSALAVPAASAVAWLAGFDGETRYCIFVAALGLPLSVEMLFRSYFQSRYEVKRTYFVTLPSGLLFLGMVLLCVRWSLPVRAVFYAGLLNAGLSLVLLAAIVAPRVRVSFVPEPQLMRRLLRDAGEVGLFNLMFMLVMRIDQILLFRLRGAAEVAQYAVAVKVTEALFIVPEALMLTVFPLLAGSRNTAPKRFRETYRLSFKYLSAAILPLALALTLVRREFMITAFGAQYAPGIVPMAILAWGMFFAYTGAVYLNLFIVERQQRLLLAISAFTLLVNVGMNLLLIPRYGATGAALAVVGANIVGFFCWAVMPATAPFMVVCMTEVVRPLGAVAGAWALTTLVGLDGRAAATLALALYAIIMCLVGGFTRADAALLRRLVAPDHAA